MPEVLSIMLKFQKFQSEYLGPFLEVVHFDRSDRSDQICCFILTNCFIILLLFSIGESRKGIENDKNHSFQLTKFKSLDRKKNYVSFPLVNLLVSFQYQLVWHNERHSYDK